MLEHEPFEEYEKKNEIKKIWRKMDVATYMSSGGDSISP